MAWARLGDGDRAANLLQLMNPVEQTRMPEDVDRYCCEPYVTAADVSAAAGRRGRGGWTWYTGSAAWMYRIWLEEILGFKLRDNTLTLDPVLPADWPGFEIRYRYRSSIYKIKVTRDAPLCMCVDGHRIAHNTIRLFDDGFEHEVVVRIPGPLLELLPAASGQKDLAASAGGIGGFEHK
jgi:cyclic beta-1,2-glucan synthetase